MQRSSFAALIVAVSAIVLAGPAAAALNSRSFVSAASGLDTNTCTRAAPCRTFAFALTATAAGGEIDVLDPGGYGPLTINKAISIINDGVGTASLVPLNNQAGILINAGPNDVVSLRGLTVDGQGVGGSTQGIRVLSTGPVTLHNCFVRHVQTGLNYGVGGAANLTVSASVFADSHSENIFMQPSGSGDVNAVFDNVQAIGGTYGFSFIGSNKTTGALNVAISNSIVAHNTTLGIYAIASGEVSTANVSVMRSVVTHNGTGLNDAFNSTIQIGESMVTYNTTAFGSGSGAINSFETNQVNNNTAIGQPPAHIDLQ